MISKVIFIVLLGSAFVLSRSAPRIPKNGYLIPLNDEGEPKTEIELDSEIEVGESSENHVNTVGSPYTGIKETKKKTVLPVTNKQSVRPVKSSELSESVNSVDVSKSSESSESSESVDSTGSSDSSESSKSVDSADSSDSSESSESIESSESSESVEST